MKSIYHVNAEQKEAIDESKEQIKIIKHSPTNRQIKILMNG